MRSGRVTDWLGQRDGTFVGNHLEMSVAAGLHIQAPLVHDPFGIV